MGRWTNELHTTTCIYNMLNAQYVMLLYTMWTPCKSYDVNVQIDAWEIKSTLDTMHLSYNTVLFYGKRQFLYSNRFQ